MRRISLRVSCNESPLAHTHETKVHFTCPPCMTSDIVILLIRIYYTPCDFIIPSCADITYSAFTINRLSR